ncbi:MAG: hypothetical protein KKB50_17015 [Planctomycetes bacterium]|nr:hypothetical protein [Planctomycetota bacterium]
MVPEGANEAVPALGGDELSGVLRDYMDVARRLQETHETLQREVVRLRNELASKDRELERRQRLAALGELAAGVAHEVRNPLGAIQLYSGLLRKALGADARRFESDGRVGELLGKIDAGIRAIDCVVQDTLALAPRGCQLSRCELRLLIDQARDVCLNTLRAHRVALRTQHAEADVCVLGEGAGLQRVLVNLIANAAEASPPGATVQVAVGTVDEQAEIHITDDGPGLSDEVLGRVFDPFFTTKEQGTGLGLTIAHRLVEAHGGCLTARNRLEGGAEFVVVLPLAQAGENVPQEAATQCPSAA